MEREFLGNYHRLEPTKVPDGFQFAEDFKLDVILMKDYGIGLSIGNVNGLKRVKFLDMGDDSHQPQN